MSPHGATRPTTSGDRAYTQAKPEHFQLPARALGYKPVLDYKSTQLGRQGSFAGMNLVDGTWYGPAMPEPLMNATKEFRDKLIDEDTHRARIEERRNYEVRPKGRPDADGHIRMACPAAGPAPLVRCALKPKSEGGDGQVRARIPVTDVLNLNRPKICTQQSVTLPPEEGAKFAQEIAHESPEWHAMYATQRNSNEGMNGFIKDGANEAVDDPERRRIRGVAAQSVLVAFQLFAANIRKIDSFLARRKAGGTKIRKLPSRRRTRSLTDWTPNTPSIVAADDATDDPDPPLTS